jgi:hypothetical protein
MKILLATVAVFATTLDATRIQRGSSFTLSPTGGSRQLAQKRGEIAVHLDHRLALHINHDAASITNAFSSWFICSCCFKV